MANEVTTGQELNSYQGNAALAGGVNETGFAPIDLSPLAVFALKKYEVNKLDYEKQQEDKAALEKKYMDPSLNVFLDPELASQIEPDLTELKELSKKHLEMNPKSEDWYRFHEVYNNILKKNANAKVVQDLLTTTRADIEATQNPDEKQKRTEFADKLKKYKLGDQVPVYEKYFPPVEKYVPTGETAKYTVERIKPDGKTKEKVEKSVNNSVGLMKKYDNLQLMDPQSQETWADIANTALQDFVADKGTGGVLLDNLNKTTADVYQKNMDYNKAQIQSKYDKEYQEYLKADPANANAGFIGFLSNDPVKLKEWTDVTEGLAFLQKPVNVVDASKDPRKYAGFTYFKGPDGKVSRLDVNDKEFAARHGATVNPPGEKETVLSSELDKTGAQIKLLEAQTAAEAKDAETKRIKVLGELSLEKARDANKGKTENQKGYFLNDYTTSLITEAKSKAPMTTGQFKGEYKSSSSDLKALFKVGDVLPSEIYITADGQVRPVYKDENGGVLTEKSVPISADEVKAKLAVNQFGKNSQTVLEESNRVLTQEVNSASLNGNIESYSKKRNINTKGDSAEKPVMKNAVTYYNSQKNIASQNKNTVTFKDGTVWEISGGKLKQIK